LQPFKEFVDKFGARSLLLVPMLKDDALVGAIAIYRKEVRPFIDKQIELVRNFAAQAVIAIENTRLLSELRQRTSDLSESLEQQTATSEVLRVISSSPGELLPVFQTMLANAARICEAKFGMLFRFDGEKYEFASGIGTPPPLAELVRRRGPFVPEPNTHLYRVMCTKQVSHTTDYAVDAPDSAPVRLGGARSTVDVPMLKDGMLVGAISIYRQEVRPFTDKQIALLQNFANQAVIAIENTRLLNELRQSLQQQTATADVLKVISRSTFDLKSVLQTLVESAAKLCDADMATSTRQINGVFYRAEFYGFPAEFIDYAKDILIKADRSSVSGRALVEGRVVQIPDVKADPDYTWNEAQRLGGFRTALGVPMLREGIPIGVLSLVRSEVRPFTDKQIELVTTFADQAVIAIENARLLSELRQSLEQQTATSDVLLVISSSPGELDPVFNSMLENATRICEAELGMLWRAEGDGFCAVSLHGVPPELAGMRQRDRVFHFDPEIPLGRVAETKRLVHIADATKEAAYVKGLEPFKEFVDVFGARTFLLVPMLKDDTLAGVIAIYRKEVRPFADKQIALVQNFAAQAVIAIENTRLLNELRESLQQQTATAEVLKVISRSTFNLQSVLDTLAESAVRLCEADMASVHRQQGSNYQTMAIRGSSAEVREQILRAVPFAPGRGSVLGRTVGERRPIQIPDVLADPDYSLLDVQRKVGFRTIMGMPILREGSPIGVIVLMRLTVRPFSEKQIELATTFADQAGIAIENVRLFDEIQDKSRQLEIASQHKSQFLANMSHELRTPLNAILGYTELMADGAYGEPSEKMLGVLKRLEANGRHLLGLINDVLDLSKIEAGQLVLELSDYSVQDIAQTVRSTLEPLAADKQLAFKVEVAAQLPPGRGDGRRLTQVLINLVGNAIKFTDAGEVAIKATANNGSFHVSVRDTGPGISTTDQAKLFQEFQQADNAITKKKGGTGLGLAISRRIIEMHGGRIWVESRPGQGSTFAFTLPVIVERQAEAAVEAQ
jgi:signal transduction histidine kinase/putative methionine-R-sulfoxide reductase with GAF domain